MNSENMLRKIKENPKLKAALKDALGRNATMDEVSSLVTGFGFDAQDVEAVLAEYQQKRGGSIAVQELDDGELEMVAGGGNGINCNSSSDCDNLFLRSEYWNVERCEYNDNCDELFMNSTDVQTDGPHHHHK